jgi:tripartite-type tricarboxylate transporter receptor subunit TctC
MDSGRRDINFSISGLAAGGLIGSLSGALTDSLGAQTLEGWPSRPVTIITPFPPGSGSDYLRMLSAKLTDSLGKPFVVDNRPGATGVIGTQLAARAKPDGYTFLLGSNSSHVIAPMLLEKRPYDPITDFEPISMLLRYPLVLVVNPSLPFKTVGDLLAFARANPGKLNYASIGQGSGTHLAAELFKSLTGVDIVHVPYKGISQAQTAVMSGEVQLWFDGPRSALQLVQANRMRALAVTSPGRVVAMLGVPTMQEVGIADMDIRIWVGLFAPKGTPSAILDKMGREVRRIVQMPDVKSYFESEGTAEVVAGSPTQLVDTIQKESKEWKALIDRLGIKLE